MPKNYQLTQFDLPLCIGGEVLLYDHNYPKDYQKKIANPGKKVQLDRIHLEEDVAKSTHLANASVIDYNRAGTPLMEIVTKPDLDTAEEAFCYLKTLQQILIYAGISDADMEKGQMRCDVNISVRKKGTSTLGEKIELKNLNSISAVRRSIYYEIDRQIEELDAGIAQIQSTRRWDDELGESQMMRTKENSHDYRYFPDPDLLPIKTAPYAANVASLVVELPHEKAERFHQEFGLTEYDSSVITAERELANYFEKAAKTAKAPGKKVANWVINNLLAILNEEFLNIAECPINPEKLASLIDLIETGIISNNQAKEVLLSLWTSPEKEASVVAKELGFEPADTGAIESIIDEVITANPAKVAEIQGGNDKLCNWLTGQVMKASKGKANPKIVTDLIKEKLL